MAELKEANKSVAEVLAVEAIPMDINDFITEINRTHNIFLKITHDKIQDYKEIMSLE